MGTVAETIMVFVLFGESWSRWELSFKVVTPILHVIFTAAQLHGSRILLAMWRKEKRKLAAEDAEFHDLEGGKAASKQKEANEDEEAIQVITQPAEGSDSGSDPIHAEGSARDSQEKREEEEQLRPRRTRLQKAFGFLRPIGHYITGQ